MPTREFETSVKKKVTNVSTVGQSSVIGVNTVSSSAASQDSKVALPPAKRAYTSSSHPQDKPDKRFKKSFDTDDKKSANVNPKKSAKSGDVKSLVPGFPPGSAVIPPHNPHQMILSDSYDDSDTEDHRNKADLAHKKKIISKHNDGTPNINGAKIVPKKSSLSITKTPVPSTVSSTGASVSSVSTTASGSTAATTTALLSAKKAVKHYCSYCQQPFTR